MTHWQLRQLLRFYNKSQILPRTCFLLNFVQLKWTGSVSKANMSFLSKNVLKFNFWNLPAILDFEENEKFIHRLVSTINNIKLYVHVKFCTNRKNGFKCRAEMSFVGSNLVDFVPLTEDKSACRFCTWHSMSMPFFVQIGSICQAEIWFGLPLG